MILDSALADAEIRSDIFVRMAGEDELHDLMLSRGEARNVIRGRLAQTELSVESFMLLDQFTF